MGGGSRGLNSWVSHGDTELFVVNKIPSVPCMKKLLKAVFKIQSQTAGWMHIGKERAKHNTVKRYIKTERLQEEGGSILGHWYGTITKRYWQALYQLNHLPRELSRDTK